MSPELRAQLGREGYAHLDEVLAQERAMLAGCAGEIDLTHGDMRRRVDWVDAAGSERSAEWDRHPRLAEWWRAAAVSFRLPEANRPGANRPEGEGDGWPWAHQSERTGEGWVLACAERADGTWDCEVRRVDGGFLGATFSSGSRVRSALLAFERAVDLLVRATSRAECGGER